jgi:serine/threonine protein kinase/tetratricopeptide (TPR) repeat protein
LLEDQRARWARGEPMPVEAYLLQDPDLSADREAIIDLIYQEVLLQKEKGTAPTLNALLARFPQYAVELKDQLELDELLASPSLNEGFRSSPRPCSPHSLNCPRPEEWRARCSHKPEAQAKGGCSPLSLAPQGCVQRCANHDRGAGGEGDAEATEADLTKGTQAPVWPTLPGYEIRGELGRGGMGVVYLAHDRRLKRSVAIKLIRDGRSAGKRDLARFHTEAEAVARLQHSNIAQIYEVGEEGDGPYLVLEYLGGGSLEKQLAGKPQPGRAAAGLVETLARAIQYAHERGIVHRDLKPANILLQMAECRLRIDKEGKMTSGLSAICNLQSVIPKIADFGLAKFRESGVGATESGDVLGTASYLPPEQAQGRTKEIGPAADTYALGAILYEMLTGRPPFRGESRVETILQVLTAEPVAPRILQPRVPRDLETICLKCLQKDPRQRYASALEMAEDLRRFLAGEPIRARPVGLWEKGVKWLRRRPAVAALLAVSAIAVLGFLGLGLWTVVTLHWYNRELQGQTRRAERGRVDAEANLTESLGLLDTLLNTQKELALVPGTERKWKKLVQQALAGYEKILKRSPTPLVKSRAGRAYTRLGEILYVLGDKEGAGRAYRQALSLQTALVAGDPGNLDYQGDLALTWNGQGNLLRYNGPPRQAIQAYQEAIHHQEKLRELFPRVPNHQHNLARYYHNLAHQVRDVDGHAKAKKLYQAARDLEEDLVARYPARAAYQYLLAMATHNLGHMVADTDPDQAVCMGARAAKMLEEITAHQPIHNNPSMAHALAEIDHHLASLLMQVSRRGAVQKHPGKARELQQAAQKHLQRALDIHGALVKMFPLVPKYRREQARHFLARGALRAQHLTLRRQGLADFYQALAFFKQTPDFPSATVHELDLGCAQSTLGNLLLSVAARSEETDRGLAFLDQATRHCRRVLQRDPANISARKRLRQDYQTLAHILCKRGRWSEAIQAAVNLAQVEADVSANVPQPGPQGARPVRGTPALR